MKKVEDALNGKLYPSINTDVLLVGGDGGGGGVCVCVAGQGGKEGGRGGVTCPRWSRR
jgi:hypothetical protein